MATKILVIEVDGLVTTGIPTMIARFVQHTLSALTYGKSDLSLLRKT